MFGSTIRLPAELPGTDHDYLATFLQRDEQMSKGDKTTRCTECGKPATGNFCQECGAQLGGNFCNQCGVELAPSAGFCNQCGAPVDGPGRRKAAAAEVVGGGNLPWWIAGVSMFVLIIVVGVNMVQPGATSSPAVPPVGAPVGGTGTGGPPDLSSMSPREAADRLFNRVMTAESGGDMGQAQQFMPMALAAYERARPLDHDGLYHLSVLNRVAMNLEESIANAAEVLAQNPDHLLALAAAAQAAIELGRPDEAEAYYRHLVEVYGVEMASQKPEYLDHSGITNDLRNVAEGFLVGR